MATCPLCGDFLDDHHQCLGAWRRRLSAIAIAALGATFGVLMALGLTDRPSLSLLAVAALLGGLLFSAVVQNIRA